MWFGGLKAYTKALQLVPSLHARTGTGTGSTKHQHLLQGPSPPSTGPGLSTPTREAAGNVPLDGVDKVKPMPNPVVAAKQHMQQDRGDRGAGGYTLASGLRWASPS